VGECKVGDRGKGEEMTQTLYAHMNKIKIIRKETMVSIHSEILVRHAE
jgi:hypothetical protein